MDIFTTQLTRVVPVPIKPANLKVKALLKEAGTGKLKEDPDHLDNHEYYFFDKKQGNEEKKNTKEDQGSLKTSESKGANDKDENGTDEVVTDSENGVKHLDLYV